MPQDHENVKNNASMNMVQGERQFVKRTAVKKGEIVKKTVIFWEYQIATLID